MADEEIKEALDQVKAAAQDLGGNVATAAEARPVQFAERGELQRHGRQEGVGGGADRYCGRDMTISHISLSIWLRRKGSPVLTLGPRAAALGDKFTRDTRNRLAWYAM